MEATDILVETFNPALLDNTVQQWGAVLAQVNPGSSDLNYVQMQGAYVCRCYGDPGFVAFAIDKQGYGIVRDGWERGKLLI
jgi:hypothetical protein